ncbi:MAG: hypothetical protein K0Q50_2066 [Vampirovibrio sp.]|jgi:hypothetical protein|nr:hypothetical protein [Vampirovibrio sp.]
MLGPCPIFYHNKEESKALIDHKAERGLKRMNLNEECLLQFLKNDLPGNSTLSEQPQPELSLTSELKRILRRKHYVSFPQAILIRRPD